MICNCQKSSSKRRYLLVTIMVLWSAIPPMLCAQSHTWYLHGEYMGTTVGYPLSLQVEHKIYQSDSATNYFVQVAAGPNIHYKIASVSLTASAVFGFKNCLEVCAGFVNSERMDNDTYSELYSGPKFTVGVLYRYYYDGGIVLRIGVTPTMSLYKDSNKPLNFFPTLCFSYGFPLD